MHVLWSSTSSHKSRDGSTELDVEGAAPESFVIGESDTEATDVEKTSDFQNSPPLFSEYSVYIGYLDSFYYRSFSFRINIKALLRTFKKEKSALF